MIRTLPPMLLAAHERLASLPRTVHKRVVRDLVRERNVAASEVSARAVVKPVGPALVLRGSRAKTPPVLP